MEGGGWVGERKGRRESELMRAANVLSNESMYFCR